MNRFLLRGCATVAVALLTVTSGQAQTIDLATGGADQIWRGSVAGANAARRLDQGPLSPDDNRRDLVIGSPGNASVGGKVHVIFSGPVFSGSHDLSTANVTVTGVGAGDGFGLGIAVGTVTVHSSSMTSNLVVGAPGALGGRGAVYVFPAPLAAGSYTTANAVYVVEGAPGDQLGTAIATADINNDGYRELVLGAPGNNRVYVISGAATLSGTRNLGTTGGDLLIQGVGIGSVLQAGDVTGDGIYEILIGAPNANAVYLLTGGYPAVSNLPVDADAVFSGVNPGDAVGNSLRVLDLDADGIRDVVIGAPGFDGPDGARSNAGATFVFWGRSSFTSTSVANANVTFHGAAASHFLGDGLASGDINRDTPNDLVMHVPGASAAGELYVYYGRARTSFGVDAGNGRRVVDFGNGQPSRRIVGDPASGVIVSAQVYEVTGEGARDVVVGVPGDSSSKGAAFFTISPKVIANPASISLTLVQGQEAARGVVFENPSTIPISWEATTNRSWLAPWPNTGTSSAGNYASITVYISSASLPVGTHTGTITFTSTSEHVEMSDVLNVTLTVTAPPPPSPGAENDFNGDGKMDLLFRHAVNGTAEIWTMDGTTRVSSATIEPGPIETFWKIVGSGDFNSDGKPDLVWQNDNNGQLAVWFMNGSTRIGYGTFSVSQVTDLGWKIVGVADINNDTKPDLIWREKNQGWIAVWLMNGLTRIAAENFNPYMIDVEWEIVGNGDFNGDGKTDLLWRHTPGGWLAVWYLDGINRIGAPYLSPNKLPDMNYDIATAGDINADGKPDILLQHKTNGSLIAWIMNGITQTSAVALTPAATADNNWRLIGPK